MLAFNDPSTCDFAFVAEGREVLVHRQVITAQSPFLRDFLHGDPGCTRINANNALFDAMVAVMSSLYTFSQLSYLLDDDTRCPFPVLLSAWEIATHFHLARQSQCILPIVVRRVDRTNVVRTLKAALKQLQSSSSRQRGVDEGAIRLRDACVAHLPPVVSSAQQQSEWTELLNKYRWLASSIPGGTAPLIAAPALAAPPGTAGHHFPGGASRDWERPADVPPPAVVLEQVNDAVRSARTAIDELRSWRENISATANNSNASIAENSNVSLQLDPADTRRASAGCQQQQQEVHDADLSSWLEQWNEIVASAAAARQRRVDEEAALRQRLENLYVDDVDVVELQEKLDTAQQQIVDVQQQLAAQRKEVEALEKDITEGQEYTASTQVYIPAAAAAKAELVERIATTKAWLAAQPPQSPQTPVVLRRTLVGFANELRDSKAQAQREAAAEENKIATLTRQIAAHIETISLLGNTLNEFK